MFKIQNITGTNLALSLEKGGIILPNGAYYDLDGICSRKWIHTNQGLKDLIRARHIRVTQDSEAHIPKMVISTNAKIFELLKKAESAPPVLPQNTYSSMRAAQQAPAISKAVFPHNRGAKIIYPTPPQDEPIIIDLSLCPDAEEDSPWLVTVPAKEPVIDPVEVAEPVVEAPAVEAPVVEAPVVEAPVVEEPVVEAPVVEAPEGADLVVEAPEVEEPVVAEPAVEVAPVVEKQWKRRGRKPKNTEELDGPDQSN